MKKVFFLLMICMIAMAQVASASVFTRNLSVGFRGNDVTVLQQILNSNPLTSIISTGPGSLGNETTYFGFLTRLAVIKFQELYRSEVLTPAGLITGTGFVGILTRTKLETLLGTSTKPVISQNQTKTPISSASAVGKTPTVTGIYPLEAKNGDIITVYGTNFAYSTNTILLAYESEGLYTNVVSFDGKTLQFKLNSKIGTSFSSQFDKLSASGKEKVLKKVPATFPLQISVRTSAGRSNPINFKYLFK